MEGVAVNSSDLNNLRRANLGQPSLQQSTSPLPLTEALQHCHGLGPVRLAALQQAGVRSWHDAVADPDRIPGALRSHLLQECDRLLTALADDNIQYFVDRLLPPDRWRILTQYIDRASYFDIETTGLEYDDTITTIVCWHKGALHSFVEHENLDDFLDLLDDIDLLVSFNGSTFDVPRVLDGFHIPDLPCPHLDLRWPCHYKDLRGGLKQVTSRLGFQRPADLQDADGELAVRLWSLWQHKKDTAAREQLIRYCAADVLLLIPLAQHVAGHEVMPVDELWPHLPDAAPVEQNVDPMEKRRRLLEQQFGSASPKRLRTWRRR
ncbi:ribonuclease H-like domain-containing protein [Fuerstiella marisgermanici]|uniref:Putative exonuclease n=1 Tax=Fuerstiella marisgermanici TaxID=1891926 RepID=A0A1P8WF69_9PLAN|nr:ribonuclease H-like domain-containing protein [Fuerstiella marisgermanici]APZ92724.1 putative exonuclease [Fuerstiella marisgermanici]